MNRKSHVWIVASASIGLCSIVLPVCSRAAEPGVAARGAPLVQPQGKWARTVPGLGEYAAQLPAEHQPALAEFRRKYPHVDPTDRQGFHAALLAERQTYPRELSEADAARYSAWLERVEQMQARLVMARGRHIGISLAGEDERGRSYALVGFDGTKPLYSFTQNVNAASTTGANVVRMNPAFDGTVGSDVSGSNLYVNVNDHGEIYENPEFQWPGGGSRIVLKEVPWYTGANRAHMTHVAGTVGAYGYNTSALGMAPRLWIRSHIQQSTSDITGYGMSYPGQPLSNQMRSVMGTTSLGTSDTGLQRGLYTYSSASFDQALWDYPYYIHFYAAGNDGGGGFGTLDINEPLSKNVLTVASVSDTSRDAAGTITGGGSVSGFSSRGPAYDGRIKPDIAANGDGLYSPDGATGYGNMSGTSMATPNASGSSVLLIHYFNQRFPGHFMRASTTKALLINTADDRGNVGPDYTYGWGIVHVRKAAELIRRYADNATSRVLVEDELVANQTNSWTYTYEGSGPIRVSLAWTDPASTYVSDRTPRLVNDLNLRLIGPSGATNFPYVMPFTTGNATYAAYHDNLRGVAATNGNNFTDNAEQIYVAAPTAGNYTLQITHAGSLSGGTQKFSLAVLGMARTQAVQTVVAAITPSIGSVTNALALTVTGTNLLLGSDLILRRDGSAAARAFAHLTTGNRIAARLDTTGLASGYWDVVVRSPDGTETRRPNAFLMPVGSTPGSRETLYANSFTNATDLTFDTGWAVGVPNKAALGGPDTAYNDTQALCYQLDANYEPSISPTRWVTLPAISTLSRTSVQLEYRRWLGVAYNQSGGPDARHADYARVEWSTNGTAWTSLWVNNAAVADAAWQAITLNLPAAAENQASLLLRFGLDSDASTESFGWNIDDLRVTGLTPAGVPLPPTFTSTPPGTATAGQPVNYAVTTSDADSSGASLALGAVSLPAWLSLINVSNGAGTLIGSPASGDVGNAAVLLRVTDGTYTTYQAFVVMVVAAAGNNPPLIQTASLPAADVGVAYNASLTATDVDGHAISLTASNRPAWLAFTDNGNGTGTLRGTPSATQTGTVSVVVRASDGLEAGQQSFPLLVRPRAVLALGNGSYSVNETNGTVSITVNRTLNSNGAVSVNYATANGTAAAGSDYTAATGTLNWTDGDLAAKTFTVPILNDGATEGSQTFTVSLGSPTGVADLGTASATITITDDDNNVAPAVAILKPAATIGLPNLTNTLVLTGSVTDDGQPANGTLAISWTQISGPSNALFTATNTANTAVNFPVNGRYVLRLAASDGEFSNSVTRTVVVGLVVAPVAGTGVMREWFTNIAGSAVINLSTNTRFVANLPDSVTITNIFETPASIGDNYGQRLRSYFIPTQTGNHVFWIASDDSSELWLSSNDQPSNKVKIAFLSGSTGSRNWTNNVSQQSSNIALVAGTAYYLEALHKEASGGDHLAVGVTLPDATLDRPITASRLAVYEEVPLNYAPHLNPGTGGSPVAGLPFPLDGIVTDDLSIPTNTWSLLSGPGSGSFANSNAASTTVTFTAPGSHTVRLTSTDGAATVFQNRTLTVVGNTAPTLTAIADQTVNENTAAGPLPFTIGDAETEAASLTVTGSTANAALIAALSFGGSGASRTVTVTPHANVGGTALITVGVSDGLTNASTSFTLTVLPGFNIWMADYPAAGSQIAPTDDPDGDGLPNLTEYALGLNPLQPNTAPPAVIEEDHLTLTYTRRAATNDFIIIPEAASALTGSWATNDITEQVLGTDGLIQTNKATDAAPISINPSRFLRLRITRP